MSSPPASCALFGTPKVRGVLAAQTGRRCIIDEPLVPAAQYLRMSTDHQEYSLDNQADAIARYADERELSAGVRRSEAVALCQPIVASRGRASTVGQ